MDRKRKVDSVSQNENQDGNERTVRRGTIPAAFYAALHAANVAADAEGTAENEGDIETIESNATPAAATAQAKAEAVAVHSNNDYPLGVFSVFPEEVLCEIMSHIAKGSEEEIALRASCKYFHTMYLHSHVEHKWRRKKRYHIMRYFPYDYIGKFREEYEQYLKEDNLDEFWWLCADRSEEDKEVLLSLLNIDSCWYHDCVVAGSSCLLRGPPCIYKDVIEYLAKYMKSDHKDVRIRNAVTICKISVDAWRISIAQGEHCIESTTGKEYSQVERQKFGEIVKSIAGQVLSIMLSGTYDKHAENRSICLQCLKLLLTDLNFPMSDEVRQKIKRRIRHMGRRDRSRRVRFRAEWVVTTIIRRMIALPAKDEQKVQKIIQMHAIEFRAEDHDAETVAEARAFIDKIVDEF